MSVRYYKETYAGRLVSQGTDQVVGWAEIPIGGVQNNVWGEVHLVADNSVKGDVNEAYVYNAEGWVVPVEDPDSSQTVDNVWDTMIAKPLEATTVFDIDTGVASPLSTYNPGSGQWEQLMGMAVVEPNNQWFEKRALISFANSIRGYVDQTDPTESTYRPADAFEIQASKNIRSDQYAMSLFGVGVPNMSDSATSVSTPASEQRWFAIMYLEETLRMAAIDMIGLVEAGAETPFEDMASFLNDLLTPDMLLPDATVVDIDGTEWNVFARMTFDITVPGSMSFSNVSAR